MIPKTDDAPTLADMRPIMLLEVLRKEWLSIISERQEAIMRANGLLNKAQKGGLPRSGTEDVIMPIKNAIEDAWFRAKELHIIGFDKEKLSTLPEDGLAHT